MKKPRLQIILHTKNDKEKAKLMEEFINYMYPPKVIKQMVKQAMLEQLAYESNPLGLIKTYWKKDQK